MSLKNKAVKGTAWAFLEQVSEKGVNFIVQIFLARLLVPEDFGLIAMMTIFITIGRAIVDSGMALSLMRTQNADERDYSSVFFLNIVTSLIVYSLIFMFAPFVARFYDKPELIPLLRVFSLVIPIKSFMIVQKTILTKKLDFKTQLLIQTPSLLLSGIAGIYFASNAYQAWALVYMQIIFASLISLQYWFFTKWKPKWIIDLKRLKGHFNFGYKLTLNTFINSFFNEIYTIIIGKHFSASTLGLYNRANTFQNLPAFIIARTINRVTLPLFSSIQNENERLKKAYKEITLIVMLLFTPIMVFFFFMAEEFILFVLTKKWIEASPILKLLSFVGLLVPIKAYNWNILNAKGRSDLVLKVNSVTKAFTIVGVFIALPYGLEGLIVMQILISILTLTFFCYYSGKFINYSVKDQYFDLIPILFWGYLSGFFSKFVLVQTGIDNSLYKMLLFFPIYIFVYLGGFSIVKYSPLVNILNLLKQKVLKT